MISSMFLYAHDVYILHVVEAVRSGSQIIMFNVLTLKVAKLTKLFAFP